ncbi:hypothetical protein P9112_011067 [Eukaryota sp. TZLM1-RC]
MSHIQEHHSFSRVDHIDSHSSTERNGQDCANPSIDFLSDCPDTCHKGRTSRPSSSTRTNADHPSSIGFTSNDPELPSTHYVFRNRDSSPRLPCSTGPTVACSQTDFEPDSIAYGDSLPQCSHSHIMRNHSDENNQETSPFPDRSERMVWIKLISNAYRHTLFLTYSGDVYGWGCNHKGQVLHNGPQIIKSPLKLPINDVSFISTGVGYSLALSSERKLYGWGDNYENQVTDSSFYSLPISLIDIPYNIKEVYGGEDCSFALTTEGNVVKWGNRKSFELVEGLTNVVSISVSRHSFVALDTNGELFHVSSTKRSKVSVFPKQSIFSSFHYNVECLLVVDSNGDVWEFDQINVDYLSDKPTKIPGLNNIVSISGSNGVFAAIDFYGKVFVWGRLSRLGYCYENSEEPRQVEAFTDIEGISVGHDFLFAFNKSTVWAWGKNDFGQLGIGDLVDRPTAVPAFWAEVHGSFEFPKQPLDRMFSGLIKLIYFEYLDHLKRVFGNHPYTKARFLIKSPISKKVAKFAKEVINGFEFLKDPQELILNENICDLQLWFSTYYSGPKVINTRIQKLDVYYNWVNYAPQLLSFFPHLGVLKLSRRCSFAGSSLNLAHLSNLKCLELDYPFVIKGLPTTLVKLMLKHHDIEFTDLSYLTSLQDLVVLARPISERVTKAEFSLPRSIICLEISSLIFVNVELRLPKLKELKIRDSVPTNITEQNYPSLKFVQLITPKIRCLPDSSLFPTKPISQGFLKSVKLIKNDYLVELSCFPWWIQYPTTVFEAYNREVMLHIAVCFDHGRGVDKDPQQALYWYHAAADGGNACAMNKLGLLYYSGKGVEQDYFKAVSYFEKSAELWNRDGMFNMAECCELGRGTTKDLHQAMKWYQEAMDYGHPVASEILERCRGRLI